jgi:2-dehydro-3-deoxygalactonokinase
MRGEETQAVGLFGRGENGVMVAPGTHSKWITVRDGRIDRFRTFATGELFAAIRAATLIGRGLPEPGVDDAAFDEGVRRALVDPAITAHLFSVRVRQLSGRLDLQGASDFLSGLLLGAEIAAAPSERSASVAIVGGEHLAARYARGLALAGFTAVRVVSGENAAARGLYRIWSMMK